MIDLVKMKHFMKIYETQNMIQAASELFITQPALSHSLKRFEQAVGYKLFDRKNQRLINNKSGKIVYRYCKIIIDEYERMQNELSIADRRKESVKIFFSNPNLEGLLLALFIRTDNSILFSSIYGNSYDKYSASAALEKGEIDIAVTSCKIENDDCFSIMFLRDFEYVLVNENNRFYGKENMKLKDCEGMDFIRGKHSDPLPFEQKNINKLISDNSLNINIEYYDQNIIRMVFGKMNTRCFFLSTISILKYPELVQDPNRIVKLDEPALCTDYYISYRKNPSEKTLVYINWFTSNYKSLFSVWGKKTGK